MSKFSNTLFNKGPNGWGGHCRDSRLFSVHVLRQRDRRAAQTQRLPRLSHPRHYCSILQHYGQSSRGLSPICPIAYYFPLQVNIKEPLDGQWGRQMENGSWTGVVAILIFPFLKCLFLCVGNFDIQTFSFLKLLSLGGNCGKKGG